MNESTHSPGPAEHPQPSRVRLIDCFMEIIAYTLYRVDCGSGAHPDFETVQADYDALLKRSGRYAQQAKISSSDWKKACFPVCAWVDEQIMCSDWPEKGRWQQNQLQLKFFQTTMAGREFFNRLEKLKENEREVREVFTYCLALGYKGRYYTDDDQMQLSEIKVENLLKYFSEDQELNLPESLFPEAYQDRAAAGKAFFYKSGFWPAVLFFALPPVVVAGAYIFYYESLGRLVENLF